MRIPWIRGVIARRILVNYRVKPEVLAGVLPNPFRPKVVNGWGMAGICLIRLEGVGPRWWPSGLGIGSENAAHRVAVEWRRNGLSCEGVYVPRRDTSSKFNALVGGRVFPGEHHHARFAVEEEAGHYRVAADGDDGAMHLSVEGRAVEDWPQGSVFETLAEASAFYERGSLGYSATRREGVFDGLELCCFGWKVEAMKVERVESSFFEDRARFPEGSVTLDSALLMRQIAHEWRGRETLRAC